MVDAVAAGGDGGDGDGAGGGDVTTVARGDGVGGGGVTTVARGDGGVGVVGDGEVRCADGAVSDIAGGG